MLKLIDHKTIFIHIPKTSGTNFKKIVQQYYSGEYFIFSKNFRDHNDPIVSIFLEKYSKKEHQQIPEEFKSISPEDWNSIFEVMKQEILLSQVQHAALWVWQKSGMYNEEKVVTISRNPYTKFISHYYASLYFLNQYFDFLTPSPTEFIKNQKLNFFIKMDPGSYLTRQIDYLIDETNQIRCDRFYKMEQDLDTLHKDFDLMNINNVKHNTSQYARNYKSLYSDELIQFVQKYYKQDFDYFGYDIDPFW